jgi:uncharacterized protein (TIGR03000 family)
MYSVVLMMAMTTGTETLDCHNRGGCSGCSGYASGGCFGGHRGHGCHGGGYGCSSYGGYGCTGGYGCSSYGGYGCTGGAIYMTPGTKKEELKVMPKPEAFAPAPAKIIVSLPADAKLTIDGVATTSTSEQRVFESPILTPNRDFHYTLRAEVLRDGKPVSVEQVIQVRAGKESYVTMTLPQGVASK